MNQTFNMTNGSMVDAFNSSAADNVTPTMNQTGITFNANPKYEHPIDEPSGEHVPHEELYDTFNTDLTKDFISNAKYTSPFADAVKNSDHKLPSISNRQTLMTIDHT